MSIKEIQMLAQRFADAFDKNDMKSGLPSNRYGTWSITSTSSESISRAHAGGDQAHRLARVSTSR